MLTTYQAYSQRWRLFSLHPINDCIYRPIKGFKACFFALCILAFCPVLALAEDEAKDSEEGMAPKPIYLPIKPSFVVNYGGAGRLRYVKADITARLSSSGAAASVRHHLPYIRNNIVRLFASQTDESISSQEGKEALRQEILKEIQMIIMEEDEVEGVDDVYFKSLMIQK